MRHDVMNREGLILVQSLRDPFRHLDPVQELVPLEHLL